MILSAGALRLNKAKAVCSDLNSNKKMGKSGFFNNKKLSAPYSQTESLSNI